MKLVRFVLLLFRQGSLHVDRIDFDDQRNKVLDPSRLPDPPLKKRKESILKTFLMSTPAGYSLIAVLAYLKNAGSMNKMYFISDSHEVIYVRLLKCASTSVLREFLPLVDSRLKGLQFPDDQLDVLAFHYEKKRIQPSQKRYRKFALVRNPFHRIVSVYLDLFDPLAGTFTYSAYWFGVLKAGMTFRDFMKTIEQIPVSLLGPHFTPQSHILEDASAAGDLVVFRVDKDNDSLHKFLQQYGIQLPYLNKQSKEYNYSSYYDAETFAIATRLYAEDVRRFGYEEELKLLQQAVSSQE